MKPQIERYLKIDITVGTRKYKYTRLYAKERINMLKKADPTGDRIKYINWLIGLDIDGTSRFPEDINDIHCDLEQFEVVKKRKNWPHARDIYFTYDNPMSKYPEKLKFYKRASDLSRWLRSYENIHCGQQNLSSVMRPNMTIKVVPCGATEIYNGFPYDLYRVIKIFDYDAGKILFDKSNWCVRHKENFNNYLYNPVPVLYRTDQSDKEWREMLLEREKPVNPFYLFLKNNKRVMLCDEYSQQMNDVWNNRIDENVWGEVKPILMYLGLKFDYRNFRSAIYGRGQVLDLTEAEANRMRIESAQREIAMSLAVPRNFLSGGGATYAAARSSI